jgi:Flp pilus assembly pilin Flp
MAQLLRTLWSNNDGQDLVEYALIILLIATALVAAASSLGSAISASLTASANKI